MGASERGVYVGKSRPGWIREGKRAWDIDGWPLLTEELSLIHVARA